jgi:hypothetical protein
MIKRHSSHSSLYNQNILNYKYATFKEILNYDQIFKRFEEKNKSSQATYVA